MEAVKAQHSSTLRLKTRLKFGSASKQSGTECGRKHLVKGALQSLGGCSALPAFKRERESWGLGRGGVRRLRSSGILGASSRCDPGKHPLESHCTKISPGRCWTMEDLYCQGCFRVHKNEWCANSPARAMKGLFLHPQRRMREEWAVCECLALPPKPSWCH